MMLTLSDAGGAALFFAATFIILFARDRVRPDNPTATHLRHSLFFLSGALLGVGLIYFGFGLAGINVNEGVAGEGMTDPYAVGRAMRPWGKILSGGFSWAFAISVWLWDRRTNPSRRQQEDEVDVS